MKQMQEINQQNRIIQILTFIGENVSIWQSNNTCSSAVSRVFDMNCNYGSYEANNPMEGVNGDIRFNLLGYHGVAVYLGALVYLGCIALPHLI